MKKLISINKAAEILNVHQNTLKRWDKSGLLRAIRRGQRGDRKYLQEDLENFILKSRRSKKIYPHVEILTAIAVMIFKRNKVLVGKRTAEFGKGKYCFTGGSLPFGESFEEGATLEEKDKAGITITNPHVFCITNNRTDIIKVYQQSITIGLVAKYKSGKAKDGSPERIINFQWYKLDKLPKPLIEADEKILKCYKTGKFYIG